MTSFDKKSYWKKRMMEKTISFLHEMDPFAKDIRDMYIHAIHRGPSRIDRSFGLISQGFQDLLRTIGDEPEKTPEGVIDLSKR